MKTFAILFTLLTFYSAAALDPEPILAKTKEIRPVSWYNEQALQWGKSALELSLPQSWYQYYQAARYAQWSDEELKNIENQITKKFPEAYETFLVRGLNAGYGDESYLHVNSAFHRHPERAESYAPMVMLCEARMDRQQRVVFSEKLWHSGQVSQSLLSYSYNLLMSLEQNALLFIEGENTTLPVFVLQDVFKVRTDVEVLNLDLLVTEKYRSRKLQTLRLKAPDTFPTDEQKIKRTLCAEIPKDNPENLFYYALTLSQSNIGDIKDQLYVVGLASQISQKRIDNISNIRENLEKRFLLDHLTVDFQGERSFATGKVLSTNYLIPMLLLSEYYQRHGEKEKFEQWKTLIFKLAAEHDKETVVENFINRKIDSPLPFIPAGLNVKSLDNMLRKIRGNIYALDAEVSNADYNFFLNYLSKNNKSDILERSKIDLSKYDEPALTFMKSYHLDQPVTKKKKFYSQYPVVNISHDGAIAYCEFLTEQYNNTEGRQFKKVKFRLPTLNEWQIAALGYEKFQSWNIDENNIELQVPENDKDEICHKNCRAVVMPFKDSDIRYPWYKAYNVRNSPLNIRGCALGNFKWPEGAKDICPVQKVTPDGWMLMAPGRTYFPNNMGLYDVVGNVAEMIAEEGKACGGSWNHLAEESTILSINLYEGPDSAIGFRVFMEVIEE